MMAFNFEGAVTFDTIALLQKKIIHLINEQTDSECRLDLGGISLVNSAALALFVELKKYAMKKNKQILFLNSPERLILLAQVCGVADWLGLERV